MCLLNVRFAPDSDRIADIAGGPSLEGYRVIRIDWGHRVVANLLARGQDLVNGLKNTPSNSIRVVARRPITQNRKSGIP